MHVLQRNTDSQPAMLKKVSQNSLWEFIKVTIYFIISINCVYHEIVVKLPDGIDSLDMTKLYSHHTFKGFQEITNSSKN